MKFAKWILILAVLLGMTGCTGLIPVQAPRYTPPPCTRHAALGYSPVKVKLNVNFTYNLRDPNAAQEWTPNALFTALNATSGTTYTLADGVTPNLILDVTITNDGQNHYGATMEGYGNGEGYLFRYSWSNDYVTGSQLLTDIANKINGFVQYGWSNNCN